MPELELVQGPSWYALPILMASIGAFVILCYGMATRYQGLRDCTPFKLWLVLMMVSALLFLFVDVAAYSHVVHSTR